MNRRVFPIWLFGVVAAAIAFIGAVLGHFVPGAGMVFVASAATGWTAYVARCSYRIERHG